MSMNPRFPPSEQHAFTPKELFVPLHDKQVNMYVCGITPYDYAHMGHGRCYVTFDVLYRLLRFFGYEVTYCRNFTDIDDKLLARSLEEYGDPTRYQEIADFYIAAYHQDMQRLKGCLPPIYEPRVTQHIKPIIEFVEELIATNHVYVADRDVYYSIESFPAYGKLSKRNIDDLLAGAVFLLTKKSAIRLTLLYGKATRPFLAISLGQRQAWLAH